MRRVLVLTLVLAVVGVLPAFAQGDRGQIAGFVKDQTGGVIPGATVTATNSQTRLTWTAVTDAPGLLRVSRAAAGRVRDRGGASGLQEVGADRHDPGRGVQFHAWT